MFTLNALTNNIFPQKSSHTFFNCSMISSQKVIGETNKRRTYFAPQVGTIIVGKKSVKIKQ